MACYHLLVTGPLLVLLASSCWARMEGKHPSSSYGQLQEDPAMGRDDSDYFHNMDHFMPEMSFWDCMDTYGLITSNITHALDHIIELNSNITAMGMKLESMFGTAGGTEFRDLGVHMSGMYNSISEVPLFMENCTMNMDPNHSIGATSSPANFVMNEEDMAWLYCGFVGEEFNMSMHINASFFANTWDEFSHAMSNLTTMMMLLNDSMMALHEFTASITPEDFAGFARSDHPKDGQMYDKYNFIQCLNRRDGTTGGQHRNRFTESITYQTLQQLGVTSAMNSLGINPTRYFHRLMNSEDLGVLHRPFIGFHIIRLTEPSRIQNMSWITVFNLLQEVEFDRDSYSYLLSHLNTPNFEKLLVVGREFVNDEGLPPPSVVGGILAAADVHWGPVPRWTASHVDKLWLFIIGIGKEHLLQFSMEAFQAVLPNLAKLHSAHKLDPFLASVVVDAAKRHWGDAVSTWTIANLQWLGPFVVHMGVQDISEIDTDDLFVLLPDINSLHFDKRQGQAIIHNLMSPNEWAWSMEQFRSLGRFASYLTVKQLRILPSAVFSDREVQRYMVANTASRGREVKEVAKRITENMGDPSMWSGDDLTMIGKVASGLNMRDLERIPKSSIRTAVSDLSKADLSPRQRMVIAKKYRAASSSSTIKKLSSHDIHEMKSLSVGLGSRVFAEMSPDDVRESLDVLAENAREMQPTQKREIVRQIKRASGGLAGSLKDLGTMVQDVPLKYLNEMNLEDIGTDVIMKGNSTTPVLSLGTIQWNKRQSVKVYRKVKQELLSTGNSSSGGLTSDTLSMLGTVMIGMTCEDIELLETNDIFRLVDVMMQQTGWTLRQTRCISNRVRDFIGLGHGFMSNFTLAEVNSLSGQIMKEFTPEELSHLSRDVCEVSFANVGLQRELEDMRRTKRQQMTRHALNCLEKTESDTIISGADMETLGHLGCELEPDEIERLDVADLRTSTLEVASKCCYDRFQMVAVGERLIEQLGSPETWTSSTMESVAPFLLSLSPHQIEVLDEDELSVVAEGIMDMYAGYGEKLPLCERELSDQDLEERQSGFVRVAVKIKETMVAAANPFSRRRKRDTTYTPTCDEIDLLQEGNIAWTTEELAAMEGETFDSCAYILGGVSGFSVDQLDVLLDKAKEVWGEPSQMTPDDLSQLGNIATRFTSIELGELNLTNIDTVYSLAKNGNWSMEQMSAAVSQYLQMSDKSLDELNSVDIAGLAQFICGLTANEIAQLNSSSYGVSTNSIDTLEVCTTEQLYAFKGHAIVTFGPVSSWQPELFTEVGVVVAGFTAEELLTLDTTSVAGITPLAISLIPPDIFGNGFTQVVLGAFDEAQALAVTEEQSAALSSSQSFALIEAEYGEEEVPPELIQEIMDAHKEPTGEPEGEPEDESEDESNGAMQRFHLIPIVSLALCHLL